MTPAGVIRLERFPTAVNGAVDAGGGVTMVLKTRPRKHGDIGG